MIYLIGGPPRCGKTTIAKKLSRNLRIPWISVDTIEEAVQPYIPKELRPHVFPKNTLSNRAGPGNDNLYRIFTAKEITRAYIKQSIITRRAVRKTIQHFIDEKLDYVVEGHHVHPIIVTELKKRFGSGKIRSAFLTRYDIDKTIAGCLNSKCPVDWIRDKTKSKKTLPKIAAMINEYSAHFEKQAKKYKHKVFNVDHNFSTSLNGVVRYLKK